MYKMLKHSPFRLVQGYFHRVEKYSNIRLAVEFSLLSICLRIILLLPSLALTDLNTASTTELVSEGKESFVDLLLALVIVAPIFETAIGQWLPISIASLFTDHQPELLIFSSIFLASLHLYAGFISVLAIFPLAVFLSWTFLLKRKNLRQAFRVTATIHSFHNFIALPHTLLAKILAKLT
jgi:hypothetical protein